MSPVFAGFQINLFVEDVERSVAFWVALGFEETYRAPLGAPPTHVEVEGMGLTLGLASARLARDEHDLPVRTGGCAAEVVLWADDVDSAYRAMLEAGATEQAAPRPYLDGRLRVGRVIEPGGHPVEVVQKVAE